MTATVTLVRNPVLVPEEPELDFEEARRMLPRRIEEVREEAQASSTPTVLPTLYSEVLRLQAMYCLERKAAQVLAGLDIEPYAPESVGAYADAKLAEALAESRKSLRVARIAKVLGCVFLAVFLVGIVRAVNTNPENFGLVTGAMLVAGVVGSMAAMVIVGLIRKWQWQWAKIERYNGQIPEYVLRKAIQVKKALPEGKLWVFALSRGSIESPYVSCPFLVLQVGRKRFFLEVWGERTFEEQESAKRQQLD